MKMKYGEVTEKILDFLDTVPENFLDEEALVLTNGKWDVHLDYLGDDPKEGLDDLRFFVTYKKDLLGKLIVSEKVPEILGTAHEIAEYFLYRNFTVSVGARNNIFLGFWLRLRVAITEFFL
jgi:hypothetical protein